MPQAAPPQATPTNAEKAMTANADSRVQQGVQDDEASRKAAAGQTTPTARPPASTDLTGPGGDPAEGKR